ncbi:phosphotransferase family protein [Comamonas serinivorans]|uniref:Phosphotransferase family protein n=1 Tax=Comamonas serinivorans TaxID=1082851 RepID=A0A1Y0EMX7_9BURK|nr:phosphotransferase family protein [Comamonas serinivorans]ARU04947.1 phosphotransferase family protein [Comamonas serinivorans]
MSNATELDWRQLADPERLLAWMDRQGLGEGPLENVLQLTGGTQNLLLRFERAGRGYVLRRPPLHPRMDGNAIMQREIRVLGALADTDVPHPRLIAGCLDPEVIGCMFYLMEPIDGFNASVGMPALHAGDPAVRHRMGLAIAEGAAALGRVDLAAVGLSDFGKTEGFLERQVPRWLKQLDSYREYAGWPGPDSLGDVKGIAGWLTEHRPTSFQPGLMHGDYHIANVMYRNDSPELAAIVDWELCTAGDPLIDVGWLMATWDGVSASSRVQPWHGFPTPQELVEHYAKFTTRDLSHLKWYAVLACFKLGLILEGSHARACAGKAPKDIGDRLHATTQALLARASGWIDSPNAMRV